LRISRSTSKEAVVSKLVGHARVRLMLLIVLASCGGSTSTSDGGVDRGADRANDRSRSDTSVSDMRADSSSGAASDRTSSSDAVGDRTPETMDYDLGTDFSFSENPNGPWRYGYTAGTTLSVEAFQLDTFTVVSAPVGFWHPGSDQPEYYPYVAENSSSTLMTDPTDSWAVQPGEVAMEGSTAAQYSVVQFAIPRSAAYDIQAAFAGIHVRLSSTDVHVLVNDVSIFDAEIDGYGGDPSFHAIVGQNPQATYHATQSLLAGDVLSFAVGVGTNGTNTNDTTGLFVHLTATN
jgi:hypothetical protein